MLGSTLGEFASQAPVPKDAASSSSPSASTAPSNSPTSSTTPGTLQGVSCLFGSGAAIFNESGLWNGTRWFVNLRTSQLGGATLNSTSNEIVFCEPGGSYAYCISLHGCLANNNLCLLQSGGNYSVRPSCGTIVISRPLNYVNVTFRARAAPCSTGGPYLNPVPSDYYEVNFTERGLPAGTNWSISSPGLAAPEGRWNSTASDSLCLRFPNGAFTYSVSSQNVSWTASGGSFVVKGPATRPAKVVCGEPVGSVVVVTAVVTVPISFRLLTYTVWFNETGLPAGSRWWTNVTGGLINGTMSLASTGTSISTSLVNGLHYRFGSAPADKDYRWSGSPNTLYLNGAPAAVGVTFNAVTFPVTFDVYVGHAPGGKTWYVNISGQPSLSSLGSSVSTALINATYGYSVGSAGTYRSPSGSFTVHGGSVTIYLNFTYVGLLPFKPPIVSQFQGPFFDDGVTELPDVLGVYTNHPGYASVVSVTGEIAGSSVPMVDVGAGLWETTVDPGTLPSGAVLNVVANYPNGSYATSSYALGVIAPPGWLVSFVGWTHGGTLSTPHGTAGWNNTWSLDLLGEFDLGQQFSVSLPFPEFAGGGSYGFLPSIDLSLVLHSGGTLRLGAAFGVSTPSVDAGPVSVSVTFNLTANGTFRLSNDAVVWQSAYVNVTLSGSVSVNVPIAGYTFNVPDYGAVTIGLSATITVSPSVSLDFLLLPSTSSGSDILPGLDVMLGGITATVGAQLTVALNAGVGALSISGGGGVGISMNIQPSQPYIEGGKITGRVFVNYNVLWWSGTLWSESGTLYKWGDPSTTPNGPAGGDRDLALSPANSSLPTPIPRYYAPYEIPPPPFPYDRDVWVKGRADGVAITNVYPFTDLAAAGGDSSALLLYTNDNVGLPQDEGLTVSALAFNATTGALSPVNITLPVLNTEVVYDPEVLDLANGSYAAVWNAIPFATSTSVSSPFNLTSTVLQIAYYDPSTGLWSGPYSFATLPGVSQSYALDADAAGVFVLDQVGPGILSAASQLVEVAASGKVLATVPVQDVSKVVAFRAASSLAVVQVDNGSFSLLNLTTGTNVSATGRLGCPISEMAFVQGSSDQVASLLEGIPNDTLVLYTPGEPPVVVPLPRNVSSMTSVAYDGRVVVTVGGPFGVLVYLVTGTSVAKLGHVARPGLSDLVTALSGSDLVIFTTQRFGNFTPESGGESFSYENLSIASVPLGAATLTFDERGLPHGTSWSVVAGTPLATTSTTGSSLSLREPYGPLPYFAAANGYSVVGTAPASAVSPLDVTGSTTVTVDFARLGAVEFKESGLPPGTAWSVALSPKVAPGPPNETGASTSATLNVSLPAVHWSWRLSSSTSEYAPARYHGTVTPGKKTKVVHVKFREVTSKVTFRRLGLPAGASWTVTIQGGPVVSGTGRSLVLRLPNGTYNYTVTTSDTKYTPNAAGGTILVAAPRPFGVTTWFADPPG